MASKGQRIRTSLSLWKKSWSKSQVAFLLAVATHRIVCALYFHESLEVLPGLAALFTDLLAAGIIARSPIGTSAISMFLGLWFFLGPLWPGLGAATPLGGLVLLALAGVVASFARGAKFWDRPEFWLPCALLSFVDPALSGVPLVLAIASKSRDRIILGSLIFAASWVPFILEFREIGQGLSLLDFLRRETQLWFRRGDPLDVLGVDLGPILTLTFLLPFISLLLSKRALPIWVGLSTLVLFRLWGVGISVGVPIVTVAGFFALAVAADSAKLLSQRRAWAFLLVLASFCMVRAGYFSSNRLGIVGDAATYQMYAHHIKSEHYFGHREAPDNLRPPVLPALLAATSYLGDLNQFEFKTGWIVSLSFSLGSLVLFFWVAFRIATAQSALIASLLFAVSTLLVAHEREPLSEPLSNFWVLLGLWFWVYARKSEWLYFAGAGFVFGLLTLTRSMFSLFPFLIAAAWLLGWIRDDPRPFRLRGVTVLLGSYLLTLLPWGMRNYMTLGILTPTESGNPSAILWAVAVLPEWDWRIPAHVTALQNSPYGDVIVAWATPESYQQAWAQMRADLWAFVAAHPVQYVWNVVIKTLRLWVTGWWSPFPYFGVPDSARWIWISTFVLPIYAAVVFFAKALLRNRATRPWIALFVLLAAYTTAITLPFTLDSRYSLTSHVLALLCLAPALDVFGKILSKR
jgi:hypothetical protein